MKKFLLIPLFALAFSVNFAHAQSASSSATTAPSTSGTVNTTNASGFIPLAPIPNLTSAQGNITAATLSTFLNNLYKYLIGLAAVLAVIEIAYGGIEIATNREDASKITDSKGRIMQAILGLVLVLLPVLVFSIINPSILSLSINLPPLTTQSVTQSGSAATSAPCTTTNCIQTSASSTDPFSWQTGNQLYPCSGSDCSGAQAKCTQATPGGYSPYDPVVCVNSSGSIDPNGRTDSSFNAFSAYSCVPNETLAVNCSYTSNVVQSK